MLARWLSPSRPVLILAGFLLLSPASLAQFGNAWLRLTPASGKLVKPDGTPADIVANNLEKDFAVGDVNRDGWDDLVVAQKVQASFPGPREGRLFLNEKGVLVDRTQQYASASDQAALGDDGFKEALDARDVELGDLDGDAWLDLVSTQVDLNNDTSPAAKRLTHPRVYRNLGADAAGAWLGLRHEDARVPQLVTAGGNNGTVRFVDGALGDCDGDGDLDLYCVDHDADENGHPEPSGLDLNDRLLINDGNGFFTDETKVRFASSGMWSSGYGTHCEFVDMNGDGRLDIVKCTWLTENATEAIYNDLLPAAPNFPGGFDSIQKIHDSFPTSFENVDINNDGRVDHLTGANNKNRYRFNLGNDGSGVVIWSEPVPFAYLSGSSELSWSGDMKSADYNLDGWVDVILPDVDIDLLGCTRRTRIYHNRGATPGATDIVLAEEKEMPGSEGWFGARGWSNDYPKGVNDVGHIDLDHDGDLDIVLGRCTGTDVWLNETDPIVCQEVVAPASFGDAQLAVCGQPLWAGLSATLTIVGGPSSGTALLLAGPQGATVPLLGGQVLAPFALAVTLPLDSNGSVALPVPGGLGTAQGLDVYVQALLFGAGPKPTDITGVLRLAMGN